MEFILAIIAGLVIGGIIVATDNREIFEEDWD